jgi:hypothetical protein
VRALDRDGKPFELEADGLLAVGIHHQTDHLNGVVMLDKLSAIKKSACSAGSSRRPKKKSSAQELSYGPASPPHVPAVTDEHGRAP